MSQVLPQAAEAKLSAFKDAKESISSCIPDSKIQRRFIQTEGDPNISSDRCAATFRAPGVNRQVWIEWKNYEHTSRTVPTICTNRAQKLMGLLRYPLAHLPRSIGWIGDNDVGGDEGSCVGFIFEILPGSRWTPPTTLNNLLHAGDGPSVESRRALAHDLANTVFCLHSIDVYHGDLRSHNIIFYSNASATEVDYAGFYLSGFELEHPIHGIDDTICPPLGGDNLYRHPDDQGPTQTFNPVFDTYSLGVVLIELAYWKPICELLRVDPTERHKPKFTRKVRRLLLQVSQHTTLSGIVGNSYAELVRMCLLGPEESFHDAVVEKLKGISHDERE
jgi:hypothetical protein